MKPTQMVRGACSRVRCVRLLAILLWLMLGGEAAEAGFVEDESGRLWRSGPFVASAAELYEAADEASRGVAAPAVMLFQGVEYRFAADGRLEIHRHWIYRVLDDTALADWSVSQMRWSPWHQERPRIKARVVRSDGERWLEGDALEERTAVESADGLKGGRRLLAGRLPGIEAGAVVEEEIILKETRPAFPWGTAHRHYTALFIPTVRGRVVLDASTRLALRHGVRRMPGLRPTSSGVDGDRVRVVFDFHDMPAVDPVEEGVPAHRPRYPHIAFSTGRSWNWVATGMGQLFEKVVTQTRLDALASDLPSPSMPLRRRLDRVLELIREQVAYNGLEINASPMSPDPDGVLASGSGDGFDIALTMVAAFRRMGLQAQAALINSGFGVDVEPRLPGFGLFNHALVRVEPDEGAEPVWIDPIAPYARPGELPLAAQGRYALLVGPATDELIRTPVSSPEDNLAFEQREVYFAEFGPGNIVETCEYKGSAERSQRRITAGLDEDARRRGYQAYAHAFHHAAGLRDLQETQATDLSTPFRLRLEVEQSHRARTDLHAAILEIPVRELARRMPAALLESTQSRRREEYVFPEPFVTEWRYVVHPPAGFDPTDLPGDVEKALGPARFEQRIRVEGEGRIVADFRFDVGQRLLAPSQFDDLKAALQDFLLAPPVELRFESVAAKSLRSGDYRTAFQRLERAVEVDPTHAGRRIRLALALLDIGLAHEAERQARQAVALAPRWAMAHWALAVCLQHDELGRRFTDAAPLAGALESLEEAIRLAPADPTIRAALPRLLNRSVDGRPGKDARVDEAISTYKKWRRDFQRPDLDEELKNLLFAEQRWDEAVSLLAETAPQSPSYFVAAFAAQGAESGTSREPVDLPAELAAQVVTELVGWRHYAAAAVASKRGGLVVPWLPADLRRIDDLQLHPQDPMTPVWRWIAASGADEADSFLHPRFAAAGRRIDPDLKSLLDGWVAEELRGEPESEETEKGFSQAAAESRVLADWAAAKARPDLAGAPHLGYRVRLGDTAASEIFLTPMGDELRIAAFGTTPAFLGMEALYRLDQGDLPGARRWLQWAHELASSSSDEDPLAIEPILYLWPGDEEPMDRKALRVAAAVVAAPVDRSGVALAILQTSSLADLKLGAGETAPGWQATSLEVARLSALSSAGAFLDLEVSAAQAAERHPASARGFRLQVEALTALGQWDGFRRRVEERLQRFPSDPDGHRAAAHWALRQPDLAAASSHFSVLLDAGGITSGDAGAWIFALMAADEPDMARAAEILEATRGEGENDPLWLRAETLVSAEQGRARHAWKSLLRAVDLQGSRSLTVEDGFLIGKIAEGAGLSVVALERFNHLLSNRDLRERSPLVWELVEKHARRARARLQSRQQG